MNQKELYEIRKARFENGQCPVCGLRSDFRHTGTITDAGNKLRKLNCPHCGSAFRAHVNTEMRFCKVTKEGAGQG